MSRAGLPTATWLSNIAAAGIGVLISGLAWRWSRGSTLTHHSLRWVAPVALALLGTTLLAAGVEGVHRWLTVGPLRLHAGALLLPSLLVVLGGTRWSLAVLTAFGVLLVLALQPDAAQATSFCAGWITIAIARRGPGAPGVILASMGIAVASLLPADPLRPVPHVEGILGIAAAQGNLVAGGGLVSLAVLALCFVWFLDRPLGVPLAAYMAGTVIAAFLGDFPVPILGSGMSPILGFYLAAAACAPLSTGGGPISGTLEAAP
jgi:hypothetical protein